MGLEVSSEHCKEEEGGYSWEKSQESVRFGREAQRVGVLDSMYSR